jgi:hypothetical protein
MNLFPEAQHSCVGQVAGRNGLSGSSPSSLVVMCGVKSGSGAEVGWWPERIDLSGLRNIGRGRHKPRSMVRTLINNRQPP